MMNLIEIQDKLKRVPLPMLDAASKGQVPSIPPYLAATELAERQRVMASQQQAQQAAQAPQQTTTDTIKQGLSSLLQQQMNQQKNMQQMAQQMGQTPAPGAQIPGPVRAARGGLMSMVRMAEGSTPRTRGQVQFEKFKQWISNLPEDVQQKLEQMPQMQALNAMQASGGEFAESANSTIKGIVDAVASIKAGPRRTYYPDEGAPSIYADEAEWAKYRGQQPEDRTQVADDSTGAELSRLLGRYPKSPEQMATVQTGQPQQTGQDQALKNRRLINDLEQPLRSAPPEPEFTPPPRGGLETLTVDAVAQAEARPSRWIAEAEKQYGEIGKNAPDQAAFRGDIEAMRAEAARLADARRKLFEAQQQGGYSGWLDTLSRSVLANQGASSGQRALAALTDLGRYNEQQRMAQPEFEYGETEADVGTSAKARDAEAKLREATRAYQEGATKDRGVYARDLAKKEMEEQGEMERLKAQLASPSSDRSTEAQWFVRQYETIRASKGQAAADQFAALFRRAKGQSDGVSQDALLRYATQIAEANSKATMEPVTTEMIQQIMKELIGGKQTTVLPPAAGNAGTGSTMPTSAKAAADRIRQQLGLATK